MFIDKPKNLGEIRKELNLGALIEKLKGEKSDEVQEEDFNRIIYRYEDVLTSELLSLARRDEIALREYQRRMSLLGLSETEINAIRMNELSILNDSELKSIRKWNWADRGFFYLGHDTVPTVIPGPKSLTLSELLFVTLEGFIEYERIFLPKSLAGFLFPKKYLVALERTSPQMFGAYRTEFDNRTAEFGWTEIQQQLYQRNEVLVLDFAKYLQDVEQAWTKESMRTDKIMDQDRVF